MSDVRLRFSGMVRFLASIISLFTGLAFATLITRNLTATEYGEWSAIGSLMIYGVFPALGLGYWYTRYTARNMPIAKFGIGLTTLFSISGVLAFFVAALVFIGEFERLFPILLVAALQVVTASLVHSINAIANGKKPEIQAYGLICFEIVKVIIAFSLIYSVGGFSLIDVISVMIVSQIIQIGLLSFLIRDEIRKKVDFTNLKKIVKSLWIPYYDRASEVIFTSDVLIITLLTSSFLQVTAFKIAFVFSSLVENALSFAYPLYIKLLGGGKAPDITTSIKLVLMFTFPMVIGIILIAKPLLFLLNPDYVSSEQVLQILTMYSFSLVSGIIFHNIILGSEKVDVMGKFKQQDLVQSSLFRLPTIDLFFKVVYIVVLTIVTLVIWNEDMRFVTFAEIWAMILLFTSIPFSIYKLKLAKSIIHFTFPVRSILKFILGSAIMGGIILVLLPYLNYENPQVMVFAPQLIGLIIISVVSYFGILFIIDNDSREFIKAGLLTVRKFGAQ